MPSRQEELLGRARTGDSAALDELLAANVPAVRAYVRQHMPPMLRAHESCSDIVSSVCREVLHAQDGFEYRGPEAFRGWLHEFARHKMQDRIRRWRTEKRDTRKEHELAADESLGAIAAFYQSSMSPSGVAIRNEEVLLVEQALDRLPDEYREVIALCRIVGLSREEAGRRLGGKSAGAVRMLLSRALTALSTEMERLGLQD
ncbi:MAG: sigma-70 family RNA polymerase sigma factor [Planctomycetes bacterium]|nr:sigma-70 family RNA polymerase sigma factor [Planctomycetota bacterium]MCB9887916.1 sigma-70 family RNA polymerase sigma factor [Planctomycetota bacterium]